MFIGTGTVTRLLSVRVHPEESTQSTELSKSGFIPITKVKAIPIDTIHKDTTSMKY